MKRFVLAFAHMVLAVFLVSCGEEIDTEKVVDATIATSLAVGESIEDMECDASSNGKFVYVSDSSEVYYCSNNEWIKFNGADGTDGVDGKDGKDGKAGKDGKDGVSGEDCSVVKFGDGMNIVCGDTNRVIVGLKKFIPDTCTILDETEEGIRISCGKDSVWQKAGKDAADPVDCNMAYAKDGMIVLACGADTAYINSTNCAGKPYDPEKFFCYRGEVVKKCGNRIYDLDSNFCLDGMIYRQCGGDFYDPEWQFCFNEQKYDLCGMASYDLDEEFCRDYLVFPKCSGKEYDTDKKFCYGGVLYDYCGPSRMYNPNLQFCYNDQYYSYCGLKSYDPSKEFCVNRTVYSKCGGKEYDRSTQKCENDVVLTKCGNVYFDERNQFCANGTVYDVCGRAGLYNPSTDFCQNGIIYSRCGSAQTAYNTATQFCFEERVYDKCDDISYNPFNQTCVNGAVRTKCGNSAYNASIQFCYNGKVYDACGYTKFYDPTTYFCHENVLYERCSGASFDPTKKFCYRGIQYDLCYSKPYTPRSGGVCKDSLYYFNNHYDYFEDLRDGHTYSYKKIKGTYWMVDYLKIDVHSSRTVCPRAMNSLCESRGRLYNWSVAMDSAGYFSKDALKCGNGVKCSPKSKVRGVCPNGWRLPTNDDVKNAQGEDFLDLLPPGHSSPPYSGSCEFGCSLVWTSTEYSKDEAYMATVSGRAIYQMQRMEYYWVKSTAVGVLCVADKL